MDQLDPLRIGVLGAARIADNAIVSPAHTTGARLVAIAARDPERARAYAAAHGVERVVGSYAELLDDPEVEVVYNPLPNGLHGAWNLAAIAAGKHVLSEKPFAADAAEAERVRDAARGTGLVVAEGFHYLHHPVTRRVLELLDTGELGDLVTVETTMVMSPPPPEDPRWNLALAGGALMDVGCYALHAQRVLGERAGGEPVVTAARAGERAGAPGVDEWLDVDLTFPSGVTGSARCSMAAETRRFALRVVGTRGEAVAPSYVLPHLDDRVIVRTPDGGERVEHLGIRSSYTYQLDAYARSVRLGEPFPTDADDAVVTMHLIDASYRAAGLQPRSATVTPAEDRPEVSP
jgi:predicted dehydrogenase